MNTQVATDTTTARINGDRLWASLMELAKIGATPTNAPLATNAPTFTAPVLTRAYPAAAGLSPVAYTFTPARVRRITTTAPQRRSRS